MWNGAWCARGVIPILTNQFLAHIMITRSKMDLHHKGRRAMRQWPINVGDRVSYEDDGRDCTGVVTDLQVPDGQDFTFAILDIEESGNRNRRKRYGWAVRLMPPAGTSTNPLLHVQGTLRYDMTAVEVVALIEKLLPSAVVADVARVLTEHRQQRLRRAPTEAAG